MTEGIKYSVIIPVYNAEKTIERCLDSLLAQKRSDIEIIAVNDGSSDKSGEILKKWNKQYESLIVIEQPNGGVSKARNEGIRRARGTYISFVDSDDYVANNYFEILDTEPNSDLLVFGSQNIGNDASEEELFRSIEQAENLEQKVEILLTSRKIMPPWNKRFRSKIIHQYQLKFAEGFESAEDFDFCLKYVLQCHNLVINKDIIYYVDISDNGSLSRKYRQGLGEMLNAIFNQIAKHFERDISDQLNKESLLAIIDYLFVKNTFTCIAEEFKKEKPSYFRQRKNYIAICDNFKYRIGQDNSYVNLIHRFLRLLLKYQVVFPLYGIAYLVKWKEFRKYTEG